MQGIIVIGPESTGTRFITKLFILAGALGEDTHSQRFDIEPLPVPEKPIVWRRSVPHGPDHFPNVEALTDKMFMAGYNDITIIVTVRNWFATRKAQVKDGHVKAEFNAEPNLLQSYLFIFDELKRLKIPFIVSTYESIVQYPESFNLILDELDWPRIDNIGQYVFDGNRKWLGEPKNETKIIQEGRLS